MAFQLVPDLIKKRRRSASHRRAMENSNFMFCLFSHQKKECKLSIKSDIKADKFEQLKARS